MQNLRSQYQLYFIYNPENWRVQIRKDGRKKYELLKWTQIGIRTVGQVSL